MNAGEADWVRKTSARLVRCGNLTMAVALAGQDELARIATVDQAVRDGHWGFVRRLVEAWGLKAHVAELEDGTFTCYSRATSADHASVFSACVLLADHDPSCWESMLLSSDAVPVFWVEGVEGLRKMR